jgi:hypothetical protein
VTGSWGEGAFLDKLMRRVAPYLSARGAAVLATGAIVALTLFGGTVGPESRSGRVLAASETPDATTAVTLPDQIAVPTTARPTTLAPVPAPRPTPVKRPAKAPPAPSAAAAAAARIRPYSGLGTWVDRFAWSNTFSNNKPSFGLADLDAMATLGVQTLYLQGAAQTGDVGPLEPALLMSLVTRAHQRGIRVVLWYLPSFTDATADYDRLVAIGRLPVEGIGVDIESRTNPDVGDRNTRLVALSQALRKAMPAMPLGAIVVPPPLMEVVNPAYWPGFPWRAIAPFYDAWLPMAYWTGRTPESGYRDGFTYTADSVVRLRNDLGLANAAVHPIGGAADLIGPADADRFVTAIRQTNGIGGSLYAWQQTTPDVWTHLRTLRR